MVDNLNIEDDKKSFEDAIRVLHAEAYNIGAHLSWDTNARVIYARKIQEMSTELSRAATNGTITWAQASKQANETRNLIMELLRGRSSPIGLAMAQQMKGQGATLNDIIAKKTRELFGSSANLDRLSLNNKNTVYFEVVKSSGKSNPKVNTKMRNLSAAGRGLACGPGAPVCVTIGAFVGGAMAGFGVGWIW